MSMNVGTFERLYDVQYPRVYRYLLGRVRDHYAAEALAAEVFATALAAFQKGTVPRRRAGTWLVEIADHMASRFRRRTSPEKSAWVEWAAVEDPEEVALRRLASRPRSGAVDASSPEYQKLLLLRIAGRRADEIDEVVDEVEGTVRSLQVHVLTALREFWRGEGRC